MKKLNNKIETANEKGLEPQVYYTTRYSDPLLEIQDHIYSGNVLLLSNPISRREARFSRIQNKTIAQLKEDLRHTYPNGVNYIEASPIEYKNIKTSVLRIVHAIKMYESQIERQGKLTDNRIEGLLELEKEEKQQIALEFYSKIVEYLLSSAEEYLVWGHFSDYQKELYKSSIVNQKQIDIQIKNRLVESITNYTTLEELNRIATGDAHVLQRFIVK